LWTAPDRHTEQDDVVIGRSRDGYVRSGIDWAWWQTYAAALAERFDKTPFMCEPCQQTCSLRDIDE
jgi:hypothetical protein